MNFRDLRRYLFGTLRGRLIVSVAVVHAVMMTLFIVDLTVRQRAMILDNQAEAAIAMSQSLATSAAGWIAANDISGLQELVEVERRYPELLFAMLADEDGRVLAHTDGAKRGLYLLDLPKDARQTILQRSHVLVDVAVPAVLGGKRVGWARVGLGQKAASEKLSGITRAGFLYALAAILIGSLIAWGMGRRITRRLHAIQETIGRVKRGERASRSHVVGSDEAASISREFNAMLDSLDEREEALRASEERYHSLIDNSMDAILLTSPDGGVLSANPEACRIFGKTEEEIRREGRWGVVDTTDPRLPALLEERSRTGKFRGELTFLRRDGSRFPGEITTAIFRDRHGRDRTSMIIRDISERKRAEQAMEQLAAIVRSSEDAIIGKNLDGNIISWNKGAEKIYGYAEHEIVGRHISLLVPPANEDEVPRILAAIRADRPVEHFETKRRKKDGTIIDVSISVSPIRDPDGRVIAASTIARDITERKRAEEEAGKLQEYLQMQIDRMPIGLIVWDRDFRVRTWNPAAASIFGFTEEEAFGKHPYDLIVPGEAQPAVDEIWARLLAGDLTAHSVNQNTTKDGRIIVCDWTNTPLKGADGVTMSVLSMVQDITERKQAEEALRVSEESLRKREAMLIESQRLGQIGSWDWDADKDIIWWSIEYYRIYGIDPAKPTPKYTEHLTAYTPESAARLEAAVKRALESGEPYELDLELSQPTETARWIVARGEAKRDANGRIWGLRGTAQNITERKLAEEQLRKSEAFNRSILESVGEGFVVIDREYRILSVNRAFLEQHHALPQDTIGKFCYQCVHHADRPCFERGETCPTKHTFETGQSCIATHVHRNDEGTSLYMETRSFPLRDAEGKITAAIEIMNDVTEKRKLENQLMQAQKMEAIGALAGGIAHDFNNILTAIIGYGSIVKMKMSPDDPRRPSIDQILSASDRAAHLTQGLLAFSRKQVISLKPVDVNEVVRSIEKLLLRLIGEDVELVTRTAGQSLIIMADAGQLEQVLMNLATNARDAMPEGGVLAISTEQVEVREDFISAHGYGKAGRYALITVSDTGAGMDEQTRTKIFDPFFTTKDPGKGTGLGLAIVYGIVKQHEGNINVYSEPGKGTTFKMYLPLVSAAVEEIMPDASLPPVGGTETILLAEDNPEVRTLNATVLREFGYRVIDAADGQEALERYEAHAQEIDLLVLDVIMPKKSGKDVSDAVKSAWPDAPILFISGYTADVIHKKGVFENGGEFLSKPVSPYELLKKIRTMLDAGRRGPRAVHAPPSAD